MDQVKLLIYCMNMVLYMAIYVATIFFCLVSFILSLSCFLFIVVAGKRVAIIDFEWAGLKA